MNKYARGGFTLIEVMVALAVMMVLVVVVYSTIGSLLEANTVQSARLEMDRRGNEVLQEVANAVRPAVLPIAPQTGATTYFQTLLGSATDGFGVYGTQWLNRLRQGSDVLIFAMPVDADGDGDTMALSPYGDDLEYELGSIYPSGTVQPGATYFTNGRRKSASLHADLARITPQAVEATTPYALTNPIHALVLNQSAMFPFANLADPNSWRNFVVVRFVPTLVNGQDVRLNEATLRADLNNDGDATDVFVLGNIEINYDQKMPITFGNNSVLLQINKKNQDSYFFQLVTIGPNGNIVSNAATGDYALRIRIPICDFGDQLSPAFARGRLPIMSGVFETTVELRNLAR